MKKIVIGIIILVLLGIMALVIVKVLPKNEEIVIEENINDNINNNDSNDNDEYNDDNPIKLGLYKNYRNGEDRKLITEYSSNFSYHNDISSFEVYYTNDEYISNKNQIKLIDEYSSQYENIANYRIGYHLNFKTNDKEIDKTILKPGDTEDFYNYLEIYLYDDYHQDGSWYSHITPEEFNSDSLLTSIKLTAGIDVSEIISDITLTAFTYNEDDFDDLGNYKGNSKYTITIKNNID